MMEPASGQLRTVRFDERFRDATWEWFRDPELRRLTGAKDQTRAEQHEWFRSLPSKNDYLIWGVESDGEPVAVFGLKNLRDGVGTWFVFIGNPEQRGRRLGAWMGAEVERLALQHGVRRLQNRLSAANPAIVALHRRLGFTLGEVDAEGGIAVHKELRTGG